MRVVVYKNLNRGDWSVAEISGRSGRGRVIGHVKQITLADVVFVVQPAAQAKVVAGAHRSVHAWAIGEIIAEAICWDTATYQFSQGMHVYEAAKRAVERP